MENEAPSSKGKTPVFGSGDQGSTPCGAVTTNPVANVAYALGLARHVCDEHGMRRFGQALDRCIQKISADVRRDADAHQREDLLDLCASMREEEPENPWVEIIAQTIESVLRSTPGPGGSTERADPGNGS